MNALHCWFSQAKESVAIVVRPITDTRVSARNSSTHPTTTMVRLPLGCPKAHVRHDAAPRARSTRARASRFGTHATSPDLRRRAFPRRVSPCHSTACGPSRRARRACAPHRARATVPPRDAASWRAFGRGRAVAPLRARPSALALSFSSGLYLKFEAGNPLLTDIWGPSNGTHARARGEPTRAPARVASDRVDHGVRARETDARRSRRLASACVASRISAIPTIAAQRPRSSGRERRSNPPFSV
jgi:hypothetical protein